MSGSCGGLARDFSLDEEGRWSLMLGMLLGANGTVGNGVRRLEVLARGKVGSRGVVPVVLIWRRDMGMSIWLVRTL